MMELNRIVNEVPRVVADIKRRLDEIKAEDEQFASANDTNRLTASMQMRTNMFQVLSRRLSLCIAM